MAGEGPLNVVGLNLISHDGTVSHFDPKKSDCNCIGIYFSAHWCPPCRGFTPMLVKWYNNAKAAGKKVEMIFVSSDKDNESFMQYHKEMPWRALDFSDRDEKNALSNKYGVRGIPTLVILDSSGNVISMNGRGAVQKEMSNDSYSDIPKCNLNHFNPAALCSGPCLQTV